MMDAFEGRRETRRRRREGEGGTDVWVQLDAQAAGIESASWAAWALTAAAKARRATGARASMLAE